MGASIFTYWPDASKEEQGDHGSLPADDTAYASWIGEVLESWWTRWRMSGKGFAPLLSVHLDDTPDEQITWTTPDELRRAATELMNLLRSEDRFAMSLVTKYSGPGEQAAHLELAHDLEYIAEMGRYAKDRGATKLTLTIGW